MLVAAACVLFQIKFQLGDDQTQLALKDGAPKGRGRKSGRGGIWTRKHER